MCQVALTAWSLSMKTQHAHCTAVQGCDAPPAQYNEDAFNASVDMPSKFSFPRSQRSQLVPAGFATPSPDTYLIKKDLAFYKCAPPVLQSCCISCVRQERASTCWASMCWACTCCFGSCKDRVSSD